MRTNLRPERSQNGLKQNPGPSGQAQTLGLQAVRFRAAYGWADLEVIMLII